MVVLVALSIGLTALAFSFVLVDAQHMPTRMAGRVVEDPVAFARAGMMHNYSYLGGFIGLIAGIVFMGSTAGRTRRQRKAA